MNYDDIVRVPEGYSESPLKWRESMVFRYIKELFKERYFSWDQKRYIRDKYGINATDYDISGIGLIIDRNKFNLDEFYAEFGPTNGSKDEEPKKLKANNLLKRLVCECCNGTLDPSSIKDDIITCEFCGTKYIVK